MDVVKRLQLTEHRVLKHPASPCALRGGSEAPQESLRLRRGAANNPPAASTDASITYNVTKQCSIQITYCVFKYRTAQEKQCRCKSERPNATGAADGVGNDAAGSDAASGGVRAASKRRAAVAIYAALLVLVRHARLLCRLPHAADDGVLASCSCVHAPTARRAASRLHVALSRAAALSSASLPASEHDARLVAGGERESGLLRDADAERRRSPHRYQKHHR